MDRYLKKRESPSTVGESSKRSKAAWGNAEPSVIAVWNCNGLTPRIKSGDDESIKHFIMDFKPCVFFLSEVRLGAASNSSGGKPGPLCEWYRGIMNDKDKKSREDAASVNSLLFSRELAPYKSYFSLADTKYAGTAMFLRQDTVSQPLSIRYNLEDRATTKANVHDPDGRVIVVEFSTFTILHTYSPNNGWGNDHFDRRIAWDEKVQAFMARKKADGDNVIWVGDLNVAPEDVDLSHPAHYRKQKGGRGTSKKGESVGPIAPENIGQPGCTDAERRRFRSILKAGDLIDSYRDLHGPEDRSNFSWRGQVEGKHGGKGMRIDHCIVSRALQPRVQAVEITGHGTDRIGFMGSDHCPVVLRLRKATETKPVTNVSP